jgi:Fur family peroxide stress response transcriptional regulator
LERQGVEQLEEICRREGLRLTHQRRVIQEALAGRDDHPTADQLYEEVQATLPDISRTTVYRVLETLVGIGVARSVGHPGPAVRYEVTTARHHHFFCRQCGSLSDIVVPQLDDLPMPAVKGLGFKIEDYSVHFTGTCNECKSK